MVILNVALIEAFVARRPSAARPFAAWIRVTTAAEWRHLIDVRRDFPAADAVEVRSGRTSTVFNVGGNNWRLITFIDYPMRIVRIADVLTHAEYDKDAWKRRL